MDRLADNTKGLTLIGVVIAVLILAIVTIAVAQLLARTRHEAGYSREKFIAVNLAREGVELARAIRDSNFFNATAGSWTDNLCTSGADIIETHTLEFDQAAGDIIVTSGGATQLLLTGTPEYYRHSGGVTPTVFNREIIIDCTNTVTPKDFVTVTTRVFWNSRGRNHETSLKTQFYGYR